jgi:hypothetical protein
MGPMIQTPLALLAGAIGLSGVLFLLLGIIAEVQVRIDFEARAPALQDQAGGADPAAAVQRPGGGSSRLLHRLECLA